MKQHLNNWLKNNQMFNIKTFKQALFKQNCLLCAANIHTLQAQGLSPQNIPAADGYSYVKANNHALCRACLESLPWHTASHCPQCGLSSSGIVCGGCINSPPDFDATYAVFLYAYPIDAMMQRYKYGNMLSLSMLFGQLLNDKINPNNVDLIIPMPMHPTRLKERGFNQAVEIAKVLNISHVNKLDYKSVIRQTLTSPQASLPLKERVKNIKGAFSATSDLTGKKIAIVDDVMTTGASLNELAKTLKKAGAAHVECWVIARTLPNK